jgi:hypothetical protein
LFPFIINLLCEKKKGTTLCRQQESNFGKIFEIKCFILESGQNLIGLTNHQLKASTFQRFGFDSWA